MGINKDSENRRRERNRQAQLRREREAAGAAPRSIQPARVATIQDGEWAGQPCFIIGGGPSLRGFDFERLRGHGRIIAINRAFEFIPFADIHFFRDYRYYDGPFGIKANGKWNTYNGRHVFLNVSNYTPPAGVINIYAQKGPAWSKSISEGLRQGNNSGTGAINLAYVLGANPIYLLGFDGKGANGATHFHDGYGKQTSDKVFEGFADDFSEIAPLIKEAGARVINLYNPENKTAFKAFPLKPIDEVIPSLPEGVYCEGALGFGDNLYQRSIIKHLAKRYKALYLKTPCPEIYWDIPNAKFIDPGRIPLRTQTKHIANLSKETFSVMPAGTPSLPWRYFAIYTHGWETKPGISHVDKLRKSAGVALDDFTFNFPLKPEWIVSAEAVKSKLNLNGKKLCLIRASTLRKEWLNSARTPKIENIQRLIDRYKGEYFFLSFADLEPGAEWLDGELHGVDVEFHRGELTLTTLFALIKIADMTITGPGWPMLTAIGLRSKCFTIFGGMAKPEAYFDASMGLMNFSYVAPSPFCDCHRGDHACNKDIPEAVLLERFEELRARPLDTSNEECWESLNRRANKLPTMGGTEPATKIGESVFYRGCYGFGDNLNQRPVIKDLADKYKTVYLKTPIPEFYWDIPNVKFIYPDDVGAGAGHRTPSKHLARVPKGLFIKKPDGIPEIIGMHRLVRADQYNGTYKCFIEKQGTSQEIPEPKERVSIFEDIRRRAEIPKEKYSFMLPVKNEWKAAAQTILGSLDLKGKKVCIVRPPTIRKEWTCGSRNPKPEYMQLLIDKYGDKYFFISVADLDGKDEVMDGRLMGIDAEFNHGELPMTTILGLMKIADIVITGPGIGAQASAAVRAKAFVILGGHAGPDFILDPAMGLDNLEYVAPNPFCNCFLMTHDCNKEIPETEILVKFEAFRTRPMKPKSATIGVPPGVGDVHWPLLIMESFKEKHGIDRLIIRFHECKDYTSVFLRNIPFVDEVQCLPEDLPFSFFMAGGHGRPLYINTGGLDYMIDSGSSLERGIQLEDIMPDYEVNWDYKVGGLDEHKTYVDGLRAAAGGRLVVIYTSSLGGNSHWARTDWAVADWMELVLLFHQANNCKVILVGAQFDRDYADALKKLDKDGLIIDCVGQTPIMQTLAVIRGADLFVGFSSGLCMMATHFKTPCSVFWPIIGVSQHGVYDRVFMTSWLPPWCRNSDTYLAIPYGPESKPDLVFQKLRKFL